MASSQPAIAAIGRRQRFLNDKEDSRNSARELESKGSCGIPVRRARFGPNVQ
jgi:hypothetical protein